MAKFQSIAARRGLGGRAVGLLALTLTGLALAALPVAAQDASPGSQWLTYNNRLDGQRYSPLKEITPDNIAQLGEVCRIQVDAPTSMHSGLIVADGVIYTATGRETVAIDATTCVLRWKFTYQPDEDRVAPSTRGVALLDGRIFRGTGDGRLIALDAATGKLLWKSVIAAPRLGESTAAAPLAANGVVYMGIGGSEVGVRGRVVALDAATGKELWRFNTIPMGTERGAETWQRPGTAKTGGGGVWGAMSLDVTTGELFVPVGNPWPDIDKAYRPGANLFTDSIVALDARTGALRWWYQVTPGDWMDLDLVAAPVLYRASGARDLMVFGGKDGYLTGVDRDTGKAVFRTPVTTVETPPKGPTVAGSRMCPGDAGGVEWNGPALDRPNNQLVIGAVDVCFIVKLGQGKTVYSTGGANFGGTVEPVGTDTGWITAVDAETGALRWKYHADKPVVAGITPTAGGVTFGGDLGGNLLVFNSKTGELVRKLQTNAALAGGVVTYEAKGRQYVALAAGNVSRNAFGALGVPSVIVLALNPTRIAAAAPAPAAGGARRLYDQVCVACHGADGKLVPAHELGTLARRQTLAETIAAIKEPKAPMPKLFPELISEQAVNEVAAYVREQLK